MTTAIDTDNIREQLQQRISLSSDPGSLRFTVHEAAAYIPMGIQHLAQLRYTGKGPKYLKPTPRTVLYRKKDIDDWLNGSVCTSTAEAR